MLFSVISALFACVGLSELISISVPILSVVYPITIVLIVLTFAHKMFQGKKEVYIGSLYVTFVVSIFDGLNTAGMPIKSINTIFANSLPLYEVGVGWVLPALLGGIAGFVVSSIRKRPEIAHSDITDTKVDKTIHE